MMIREYEPSRDEAAVYALWQQTLGHRWPLSRATFHDKTIDVTYQPGDHCVVEMGEALIGFVGTHRDMTPGSHSGGIKLMLVAPTHQRQGVGRTLLAHALTTLKQHGVTEVYLGAGGHAYFWAGVPTNLSAAWSFFQASGWSEQERTYDLVRSLGDDSDLAAIATRVRFPQLSIVNAVAADIPNIAAFEAQHFPAWLAYYREMIDHGDVGDILLAQDAQGHILGTALIMDQAWREHDIAWKQLLGERTGGIGVLGVIEAYRGQGIGLALAAHVTEQLQARGIETSYIGYTWLIDWYAQLGYAVWREYHLCHQSL